MPLDSRWETDDEGFEVPGSRWTTKDSGERVEFDSGMHRDMSVDKPRFDLILPEGIPYKDQMLTRWAWLMLRGALKYDDRNWEKADGPEELARFKESAFRHFMQWYLNEDDEDHAAAVMFNVTGYEATNYKMQREQEENPIVNIQITGNSPDVERQIQEILSGFKNNDA